MAVVRNLMVRAGADFSGLYKEMKTANTKMQGFSSSLSKAFKGAAIAGAALAVGTYMKDAVVQASNLNEAMSASSQVFGDAFGDVEKYAKQGAMALGQTRQQVFDAARQFGVFGNAAGLASSENAKFSTNLVGLATDLASFNNTSVDQAITALAAGLRGESEPLRQYGVLLDEATLRQEALTLGIVSTTKEALTPQQRVLAANAAIMKQTSMQQGDFARTSGGLANQQRIFAAQLSEVKVSLGQAFLPLVNTVMPILNSFLQGLTVATSKVRDFFLALYGKDKAKAVETQKNAITKNSVAYDGLAKNTIKAKNAQKGFLAGFDEINAVAEKNAAAVEELAKEQEKAADTNTDNKKKTEEVKVSVNKSETLQQLQDLFKMIRDDFTTFIKTMGSFDWSGMWQGMVKSFDHIGAGFIQAMKGIWRILIPKSDIHDMSAWKDLGMGIAKIFGLDLLGKWMWEKMTGIFEDIKSNLATKLAFGLIFWNAISTAMSDKKDEWKVGFNTFVERVKSTFKAAFTFGAILWGIVKNAFDDLISEEKIKKFLQIGNAIVDAFTSPFESIKTYFKTIVNFMVDAVNVLIKGMNKISFSVPEWVPKSLGGGKSFGVSIPTIPKLARGGIIDSPTIAQVGEAGKEMVVPLENTQFVDKLAGALGTAVMTAMQMGGSGTSGGTNIVIDGVALARAIQPYTSKESTRIGNSMIVAR